MRSIHLLLLATLVGSACNCGGRVSSVKVTVDVSPRTLDFGVQAPGQLARRSLSFVAHGAPVSVASLTLRDDARGSFSLGIAPMMLQPEVPATIEVVYAPKSEGADSALVVASFVDVADEVTVPVVGRALLFFDAGMPVDAGFVDAGVDAGFVDAGVDAGFVDAGVDAGFVDAGVTDAGLVDAGVVVDAGFDAGLVDAGLVVDAGSDAGLVIDAGSDAGVPVDAGVPIDAGYGPPNCPVTTTIRDVSAMTSALPNVIWVGSGYVVAVDERVTTTAWEVSLQRTDARGGLVAGPSPISPVDGSSSIWPSVAFSGSEYAITWLDDRAAPRRVYFARANANLQKLPGSEVVLSPTTGTASGARVVWSPALSQWGVAWSTTQVVFQRFDAAGVSLGQVSLGTGTVSEAGNPLVATPTGWALVISGNSPNVVELGTGAPVVTPLPGTAQRASIAYGAGQLAVAHDMAAQPIQFLRVQGGAVVANSTLTVGTMTTAIRPNLPSLGWNGAAFFVVWSETASGHANQLLSAAIAPTMMSGNVVGTPLTVRSNAGFNSLAIGSCGFALTYGTFSSPTMPDALEIHP